MKLVAIIVAYRPNNKQLLYNINSFIEDIDQLLIYKNSKIEIEEDLKIKYGDKIIFLGNEENYGIGKALNTGVLWAKNNLFSHILTFDQDSFFTKGHLSQFKTMIFENQNNNIGVFCPNIDNRGSLLLTTNEDVVVVPDSITSGTIFPVENFQTTGWFNEELFIDAVDYEFCYRINHKFGLLTVIYPKVILKHEVGNATKIKFGFMSDNYSAFRTFFIVKNHFLIWRKYPILFQKNYKITLIKIHIIHRVIKIIIGEEDKIIKLKAIARGLYKGLIEKNIL